MSDKTALVVSAHSADFVWRAGGAIALHTGKGFAVTVICLSYGERGESAKLWRQSGMTLDRVKAERQKEAEAAATASRRRRHPVLGSRRLPDHALPTSRCSALSTSIARSTPPSRSRTPRRTSTTTTTRLVTDFAQHARIIAQAHGHKPGEKVLGAPAVLPIRAASARAVRLEARRVARHHERLGQEARRHRVHGRPGAHLGPTTPASPCSVAPRPPATRIRASNTARATSPCSRMSSRAWRERRLHRGSSHRRHHPRRVRLARRRHGP